MNFLRSASIAVCAVGWYAISNVVKVVSGLIIPGTILYVIGHFIVKYW